jgi:hypothetical protein
VSDHSSAPPGDLQFDRAEPAQGDPGSATCAACARPLAGSYYQVNGHPACERCKAQIEYDRMAASGGANVVRAAVFGFGAALAGGALWYAVRAGTGYEVGLIAVVVGFMVGGAVRAGGRRRGGLLYQAMAVALTYFGICIQYVPDIIQAIREQPAAEQGAAGSAAAPPVAQASPVAVTASSAEAPGAPQFLLALGLIVGLAMAAPFLGGVQNIIGILIIGFALWEAWKINRHVPLQIEGPFRLGASPPPGPR